MLELQGYLLTFDDHENVIWQRYEQSMGVDLWPSKEGEGYTPTGAYPPEVNDPVSHETLPMIPHHHEESNLKT